MNLARSLIVAVSLYVTIQCRLAVKEILLEAAHNKQQANDMGATGWYVCTVTIFRNIILLFLY